MADKAKSQFATRKQIAQILELLKENIEQTAEQKALGMCSYKNRYSDSMLAREVGVNVGTVQKWRIDMYGKLVGAPSGGDGKAPQRYKQLESDMADLTVRFDKLVETLSLNKVANVRHLKKNASQRVGDGA